MMMNYEVKKVSVMDLPQPIRLVAIMNLWFMLNIKVCFYNMIYSGLKVGGLSYVAP